MSGIFTLMLAICSGVKGFGFWLWVKKNLSPSFNALNLKDWKNLISFDGWIYPYITIIFLYVPTCWPIMHANVAPTWAPLRGVSAIPAEKRSMSAGELYRVDSVFHKSLGISLGGLSQEQALGMPHTSLWNEIIFVIIRYKVSHVLTNIVRMQSLSIPMWPQN